VKNGIRLALALSALALAAPTFAQTAAAPAPAGHRPMWGIGISVLPFTAGPNVGPTAEIYVPINIAPQFRLEPSLGIFTADPNGDNNNSSNVTIGIGGFWVKPLAQAFDMYAGGRLKLNFSKQQNPAPIGDQSDTDVIIAAALGGEYYVVPHFSVGLEGQFGLYALGTVNGDTSGWATTGLAFMRLYF
jgi:hypothetical protein